MRPPPGPPFRVTHVFFDVDGTLVDFRAALTAGLLAASEFLSERSGRTVMPEALQEARRRVQKSFRGAIPEVRERSFHQVLRERGIDDEAAAVEAVRRFYESRDAALAPYADVVDTLKTLRDRGFVLIAATNGDASLMHTPMFDLLHHIFTAAEAGFSKPHPRYFELALERFGADAQRSVVVGDRLDNDVEPAVSIGIPAILLDRAGKVDGVPVPAGAVVRSLTELPPMLELAE